MLSLIAVFLFGLVVAVFALQNTATVPLHLLKFQFLGTPVYMLVIASILAGVIMSWFISILDSVSFFIKLRRKDDVIVQERKTIDALQKEVQSLKTENAQLHAVEKHEQVVAERKDMTEEQNQNFPERHWSFFNTLLHPRI